MRMRQQQHTRPGAVTVEAAIVYPILFLLMLGLFMIGMGVFHHQQVACQACEASRFAALRGAGWQEETEQPSPTKDKILKDVVLPLAFTMDPALLKIDVLWVNQATGEALDWDRAPKTRFSLTRTNEHVVNTVRITVSYDWLPGTFIAGPVRLSSSSEFPMGS